MLKKSMTASGSAKNTNELRKLWDALTFVQRPVSEGVIDYFTDGIKIINTSVILGKKSKHPLRLGAPILIAAMSTGALSPAAKIALAKGSTKADIAHNTGEGGILDEERRCAKKLIAQYSTGRFGWPKREDYKTDTEFDEANSAHVKGCAGIEIKFGQGAKPGQGGLLMGDKVTPLIAQLRKIPEGKNCHSPASHPDIKTWKDLKAKIDWFRKISDSLPIIVKFGAGPIEKDIDFAVKAGADIIAIDGSQGGTGASPEIMLNEVGVDTMSALVRARKHYGKLYSELPEGGSWDDLPDLIIGGGLRGGADIAKAIALGAKAVFLGIPFMKALGCVECKKCYKGTCRLGIATQDPTLISQFDIGAASNNVRDFVEMCTKDLRMIAGICGKKDIALLNKMMDLRCIPTTEGQIVNKITSIPMSYENPIAQK